MTTRFVIPAAVAMSLHAFALFGTQRTHDVRHPPFTTQPIQGCTLTPLILDEPVEVVATEDPATKMPKGEPAATRTIEPPSGFEPTAKDFVIPPSQPVTGPVHATVIPSGPIGDPNGIGNDAIGGIIAATRLDHAPRTRSQPAPVYPYEAKNGDRNGEVVVEFTVDETGQVLNPRVVRSTDAVFESPTLRAVAKWRFEPGRKDGRVVRFRMAVPVQFSLRD